MERIRKAVLQIITASLLGLLFCLSASAGGSEISFYRPGTGVWYSIAAEDAGAFRGVRIGRKGDLPVPGDYDGDGLEDIAIWRPETGEWIISRSSDNREIVIRWGSAKTIKSVADMPVPGDYDGDGITDIAVFRPDTATWYILLSSGGFDPSVSVVRVFGKAGDVPVPADYDGDKLADLAVFRPTENSWNISETASGDVRTEYFGIAGDDLLVPGDYTGDQRADLAVFRRGTWLVKTSETGEIVRFEMGTVNSIPIPRDLDADGIVDFAVFENGVWHIYYSSEPRFASFRFGQAGDSPIDSIKARPSLVPQI
ncbi:MAG TPA: VCBS repeat-containing protein [Pyrinomonadaceae bacterium]|nr:VCBS repeat-containing protein [Pyrinomonadaceae bacterium]HMP65850.1 VCBS repeat-containing protein [Pyrinomonadaceae bacterium]